MNFKLVLRSLGVLLICEAFAVAIPIIVAAVYREQSIEAFIYTFFLLLAAGLSLLLIKPENKNFYSRDGFAIVAFGWILISFFGSLPFFFSGAIASIEDCIFESISGFTTTGATILTQVEGLPRSILFWRSFTNWIGGMGVLMLALAIIPSAKSTALHIIRAESPGPNPGKLVPKIGQTAKILYGIYTIITGVEIILLLLAGMPLFDSLVHAFGTAGTGGFSIKNASIGAYNNVYIEIIISVFMLLFGVNFALYYRALKGDFKSIFKDEELRFYIGVTAASIALITFNTMGNVFTSLGESLRHSSFQVASIITTTGYTTANFDLWPMFSKIILLALMFIGGCAGSTSGAIKNIRILLLLKILKRALVKIIHPRAVSPVKIGGKIVEEETLAGVLIFFFVYIFIFILAVLIVSLDGKDIGTTISSVAATIGNIGPGIGEVGAAGNFHGLSVLSKLTLSLCMIIGRLEIFPILLLMTPSFWKKTNI
jgi:trk system potassium uptake protein TrkH